MRRAWCHDTVENEGGSEVTTVEGNGHYLVGSLLFPFFPSSMSRYLDESVFESWLVLPASYVDLEQPLVVDVQPPQLAPS
jgi:hypothetical protein